MFGEIGATFTWLVHVSDYRNFLEHWKMIVLKLIVQYQTIVSVTESQKRLPKWRQHFVKNG